MNIKRSKLTKKQRIQLIEHFIAGSTARTTANIVGVNKNTAQLFFHRLRELIAEKGETGLVFDGEIEADESYFGGKRKGKRGRGSAGKVPVFGLLKRSGKLFAEKTNHINGIENFLNQAKRHIRKFNGIPKKEF